MQRSGEEHSGRNTLRITDSERKRESEGTVFARCEVQTSMKVCIECFCSSSHIEMREGVPRTSWKRISLRKKQGARIRKEEKNERKKK